MMKHVSLRALLVAPVLASAIVSIFVACSSTDDPKSSNEAGEPDADPDAHDPNRNCVKPGTKNNEQGIGGYCQKHSDCVPGVSLCTGEFGAPPTAYFCTRLCAKDPNCGDGLYCAVDDRGTVCVPYICGVADASLDASADAGTSGDDAASSDASVDVVGEASDQ